MVTVLEQLKAEYEASAQSEWTIGSELLNGRVLHVGPFYGYDYDALEMYREDPNAIWVVHAHNRMPLLLAVAEAAADIVRVMTPIEHPKSPTDYAYGKVTNEQWRALVATIAPLLEEAE